MHSSCLRGKAGSFIVTNISKVSQENLQFIWILVFFFFSLRFQWKAHFSHYTSLRQYWLPYRAHMLHSSRSTAHNFFYLFQIYFIFQIIFEFTKPLRQVPGITEWMNKTWQVSATKLCTETSRKTASHDDCYCTRKFITN